MRGIAAALVVLLAPAAVAEHRLLAQLPSAGSPPATQRYGDAVATAGSAVLIGAPSTSTSPGSATVTDPDSVTAAITLTASTPSFGAAVAFADGDPFVAAPNEAGLATSTGTVRRFDRTTGALELVIPNPGASHAFGTAVAATSGAIAVGTPGGVGQAGRVYLIAAATGAVVHTMIPPDTTPNDRFGSAVAIRDGVVAVGAPGHGGGRAYLFDTATGAWLRTLVPPATPPACAYFGEAVALTADKVLVGAPGTPFVEDGCLQVFDRATGLHQRTIENPRPNLASGFGGAIAASDAAWFVAATTQWAGLFPAHPVVHVLDIASGTSRQILRHPGRWQPSQAFGAALAIRNTGDLAVGAPVDAPGTLGGVYLFSTSCPRCGACEHCVPDLGACMPDAGCRPRVWLLGDSLTHLYADDLVSIAPEWDVENLGFPFEISGEGMDRLADLLRQVDRLPHVALSAFGTNDVTFGFAGGLSQELIVDAVTTHVTSIRQQLLDAGVRPITGSPIHVPRYLWAMLFPDPTVAAYRSQTVLEVHRATRPLRPRLRFVLRRPDLFPPGDPIHPSDEGQAVMAWRAKRAIRAQLAWAGFR